SPRQPSPRRAPSRPSFSWVLLPSSQPLRVPQSVPLEADCQNACDLGVRGTQPGTVVECAGRGLEAEVEELLAALAERPLKLVVCHLAELPSFQRDQPLSSRSWS